MGQQKKFSLLPIPLLATMFFFSCDRAAPKSHEILEAGEIVTGESIYQIQARLVDQEGNPAGLDVFAGHPVVISMFYSSCAFSCPMLVDSIRKKIENQVDQGVKSEMRVLLVTFDPARDTPEKLKKLAVEHSFDLSRWKLLTASESTVRDIAAVLGVKYRQIPGGDFNHSSVIALLDENGIVVSRIDGLNQPFEPMVEQFRLLSPKK